MPWSKSDRGRTKWAAHRHADRMKLVIRALHFFYFVLSSITELK